MKIRLLEILGYSTWGGAAQSVLELVCTLPADCFDVTVASPCGDAGIPELLRDAGIHWIEVPLAGRYDYGSLYKLIRLIRWERFDVVHTHCRNADLIGGLAARIAGVKAIIMHARGLYLDSEGEISKRFVDRLHRAFLNYVPVRIVAISEAVRQESLRVLKVSPSRVTLILHAIDHKRFQSVPEQNIRKLRRSMEVDSSSALLLSIGSLNKSKGYDILLEAISRLRNYYSVKLVLVGDGPERDSLEKLTDELGLRYCVSFLGVRKDVPALLKVCDIFVHPARWEGFGRVIAEAMAVGRPVIASEVGGIPEIIKNGESGLLVPPNNPYALANAIQRLLDQPLLAESLAVKGLDRARRYFSIERSSRETVQVLRDVVKEFGSRG